MGRVLTIKRATGKPPISPAEIERLLKEDASLEEFAQVRTIYWTSPSGVSRWISVGIDQLETEDVRGDEDVQFLDKLQSIALNLDAQVFESKRIDPSLPNVPEAQRVIHDPELCYSMTKFMASYALVEACEDNPSVTIEDMLRCLDYGGVIAENGARCLYVRTGRDGLGWKSAGWNDLPYVVKRADWEAYLREHYRNDID